MNNPVNMALEAIKPLGMKDLRLQCRARGISPAGSKEVLVDRLVEHMADTKDFEIKHYDDGTGPTTGANSVTGSNPNNYSRPDGQNVGNFMTDKPTSRVLAPPGGGQSFTFGGEEPVPKRTPKPNSAYKLTAPYQTMPEGMKADDVPYEVVNIDVPDFTPPNHKAKAAHKPVEPAIVIDAPKPSYGEVDDDTIVGAVAKISVNEGPVAGTTTKNNNYSRPDGQNVGNFITDKPSSRVLAPPGGGSNICLG